MKNIILKTITWIAAILFIFSATAVDSISNIPRIVCLACSVWILLFMFANRHSKVTVQDVLCGWD